MTRREFLQVSFKLGLLVTTASAGGKGLYAHAAETGGKIELPPLPYDQKALEPYISARTIEFHCGKHHQAYVNNLKKLVEGAPYANQGLEDIIKEAWAKPADRAVFNNVDRVFNRIFRCGYLPVRQRLDLAGATGR